MTTDSNHTLPIAPNLLRRDFSTEQPNQVYAGDITYIYTQKGWLYLAVVIDLFSRQVVGWAMDSKMEASLVNDALSMAIWQRKPARGLIWHTDRGSQYELKYPKATECLLKDKEELLTFYDFPAEHWKPLQTTNPIESTFATVRHRTKKSKGCFSRTATLTMVFKLCKSAEERWIKLNGFKRLGEVINGVKFVDGIKKEVSVSDDEAAA